MTNNIPTDVLRDLAPNGILRAGINYQFGGAPVVAKY